MGYDEKVHRYGVYKKYVGKGARDNESWTLEWSFKNKKDAEKVFLHSKWNDHHGLGYIRRRKYLVDDRPKIDFTEMKEHPRASYIALEKTENGVKLIFCNHQQLELKEYESNLEEV